MSDPHVVVTGATKGLGRAMVRRLAMEGSRVSFGARSTGELEDLFAELIGTSNSHLWKELDVSNEDSVSLFFSQAINENGPIDAVVHCAGVYGPFGPSHLVVPGSWMDTLRINLYGTFLVTRESIAHMLPREIGRVIVLSGGGATSPMPNISAYAASKAGVVRLVETLAGELKHTDIQINAVAPGLMATQMLDQLLETDRDLIGGDLYDRMLTAKENGEDSTPDAVELISFLTKHSIRGMNGRLISAKWDPWETWLDSPEVFDDADAYTLRRQVPD